MKIGIIGYGYTGQQHARALEQIESATLVAVAEISPERRAESTVDSFDDYQALLDDPHHRRRHCLFAPFGPPTGCVRCPEGG